MIALVAAPLLAPLVRILARSLPALAVCSPGRAAFPAPQWPVYRDLRRLLDAHPVRAVVFLWPYPGLEADLAECDRRQLPSLSAGPVASGPLRQWGSQHRWAPVMVQARAQRQRPAFGEPVYLRRVAGGGTGLLPAWWAACQLLDEAEDLLDAAPVWAQVAASRAVGRHQLVVSAAFANGANAHLVVSPNYLAPSADLTLLGSGGLVFSEPTANTPVAFHAAGPRLHQPAFLYPEPAWVHSFLAGQLPPVPPARAARQYGLLPAIRRALRQNRPVPLPT